MSASEIRVAVENAFRDFDTAGVPASGAHDPIKAEIRDALGRRLEIFLSALEGGIERYATKALMDADVASVDGQLAYVFFNNADSDDANNGYYQWNDGGNVWVRADWMMTQYLAAAMIIADGLGNRFYGSAGNDALGGSNNTGFGLEAGRDLAAGGDNVDVGRAAGRANVAGNQNTSVGTSAGLLLTGGNINVRVGYQAQGQVATETDGVTVVGANAYLYGAADEATVIGAGAGSAVTTAIKFTAVGAGAGGGITTSSQITMIGWAAGQDPLQTLVHNNQTAIGAQSYCDYENQVTLGNNEVQEVRLFGAPHMRSFGFADTIIGRGAGNRSALRGGSVIIGFEAGVGCDTAGDERQIIIGYLACNEAEQCRAWVAIGDKAGQYAFKTIDCTLVGSEAGRNLGRLVPALYDAANDEVHIKSAGVDVSQGGTLPVPGLVGATFVGKNAGRYNTIGGNNTGLGDSALGFTTVGGGNTAVGYVCGEGNVVGSRNTWVGQGIRVYAYSGDDNAQIGYEIGTGVGAFGNWLASGSRNSNLGAGSVYRWNGNDTVSVGFQTLRNMTAGTGGDVALGARAGDVVITGGKNIFIGQDAAHSAAQATDVQNSIVIGAGASSTKDNQTVLGNDDTAETVIRGAIVKYNVVTVAQLPAAAAAGVGARAMVNNANSTVFNSVLAAGGANIVPVFSDGANWRIG